MSPTVRGFDDGRPALTEANREAYSFAVRLERHVSLAAAAGARRRVAAAIRRELAAIQSEIDTAANTSTTTSTSTSRGAGT
jgi:hypothetical protein